jgi:DnaJ-class molecular chaperone
VSSPVLAYAVLALSGRLTLAEATAGAALWEDDDLPATPREAVRMLLSHAAAANGKLRTNCQRCDGRGFFRGYKASDNEALAIFCDDCDGNGTTLVRMDE